MGHASLVDCLLDRLHARRVLFCPLPDAELELERDAVNANLRIVSGAAGRAAVADYWQLLREPQRGAIGELLHQDTDATALVSSFALAACETWRRLVFRFTGWPWRLFALLDSGQVGDFEAELYRALEILRDRPCCVDQAFATVVLKAFADGAAAAADVQLFLADVLSSLRTSSVSVERPSFATLPFIRSSCGSVQQIRSSVICFQFFSAPVCSVF